MHTYLHAYLHTILPTCLQQKEFEELIANLKITKGNEPMSQSEEPLSPQSFAMVGTRLVQSLVGVML
jgi:hypothetical protein